VGITFTFSPDASGGLQTLIDRFNEEHKGEIKVTWRTTPAASDEYFE
jgi:multiple sugar transport system substrate-binding protein